MSIRIACPLCNKSIAIEPQRAGKTIKCPGCEEPLMVVLGKSLALISTKKKASSTDSIAEKYKTLWVGIALALLGVVIVWTVRKIF